MVESGYVDGVERERKKNSLGEYTSPQNEPQKAFQTH